MKERRLFVLYLLILILAFSSLFLSSCGAGTEGRTDTFSSFSELEDKRIGVHSGSIQAQQAAERFPDAELYNFPTYADMLSALRKGKIDAFAGAEALVLYMMGDNPDMAVLPEMLSDGMKVCAIFPQTEEGRTLCGEYNEYIRKIKENGIYDEVLETWTGSDSAKRTCPDYESLPAPGGAQDPAGL